MLGGDMAIDAIELTRRLVGIASTTYHEHDAGVFLEAFLGGLRTGWWSGWRWRSRRRELLEQRVVGRGSMSTLRWRG